MTDKEQGELEKKAEFQEKRLREWAITLGVNINDIYHTVFVSYKTDNQLREIANRNATLVIEQKRIELAGQQFLIDQYYTARKLNSIRKKQVVWYKRFIPKRKSGQPPR